MAAMLTFTLHMYAMPSFDDKRKGKKRFSVGEKCLFDVMDDQESGNNTINCYKKVSPSLFLFCAVQGDQIGPIFP
jgi:hypothetical protein